MFAERGGSRRLQQNTRRCPGRENNPYCGAAAGCWWAMVTPRDVGKEPPNPPVLRNKLESGVPSTPWQSPSPAGGSAQLLARRTRGAVGRGRGGYCGASGAAASPSTDFKGLISPCCVGQDSCVLARPTRAFLMAAERGWYLV